MGKFDNVNLEALGTGVILSPIQVKENLVTASNISMKATHDKHEFLWKGECIVVRAGENVTKVKAGDTVFMNMGTRNKLPFEHKGHKLIWTVEDALFARILPDSKIIL